MSHHHNSAIRKTNQIITICFLLTLALCCISSLVLFPQVIFKKISDDDAKLTPTYQQSNLHPLIPSTYDYLQRRLSVHDAHRHEQPAVNTPSVFTWPPPQLRFIKHFNFIKRLKKETNFVKSFFIEINTLSNLVLQHRAIHDDMAYVFKLNNGLLTHTTLGSTKNKRDSKHLKFIQHVNNVKKLQDRHQGHVLVTRYIAKPFSQHIENSAHDFLLLVDQEYEQAITGLPNDIARINFIDEARNDNKKLADLVYKTDHHWKELTGFWAFIKIAQHYKNLNLLNVPEHLLNINNFSLQEFPNSFLGTEGARVGKFWAGIDDFHLITPRFETSFEFWAPFTNQYKTGDFEEIFFTKRRFTPYQFPNNLMYGTYIHGLPLMIIKNNHAPNAKKLLAITDSFAAVVSPFLCLLFEETHLIDPREFGSNIDEYIQELQPDAVIYIISPDILIR